MAGQKLGDFVAGADFDVHGFHQALSAFLKPLHFEPTPPFLVGWYNGKRSETAGGSQAIDAPDSAVAFALCTVPGFLDVVVEYFARVKPEKDFVDSCACEILDMVKERLSSDLDPLIVNTDQPPYYHVQTIGAVAGYDQHMEASDVKVEGEDEWLEELSDRLEDARDPKMWGTEPEMRRKVFGVNVHPHWGGWYAYRGLLVLRGATAASLVRPEPLNFVPKVDAKRIILEYNLRHDQCLWRDLTLEGHPPDRRYKAEEYFFFMETSSAKRKRYLQIRADSLPSPPAPRVS